jgi:hypothetical protein
VGHSKAAEPRQAGLQTCTLGADLPVEVSSDLYLGSVDPPRGWRPVRLGLQTLQRRKMKNNIITIIIIIIVIIIIIIIVIITIKTLAKQV